MKETKILFLVISIAIFLRIIFVVLFIDVQNINQWEYGEIAKNIIHGNGYSLYYFENDSLDYKYQENISPFPSSYMPPGYVLIILPFYFLQETFLINIGVILFHIIISSLIIYLLFHTLKKYFNNQVAIISIVLYAILPEFIYSVVSFSPTIIFHLIIIIVFNHMLKNNSTKFDYALPILLSLLLYLRSEMMLFVIFVLAALLIKQKFKTALINLIVIITLILPWTIRNYIEFNEIIPLSSSFGRNLYRGNNSSDIGWWGEEIMMEKIKKLPRNDYFEVHMNDLYLNRAVDYIKNNPEKFIINGMRKQFELWVFNLTDPRSKSLIYLIPSISVLLLFIIGVVKSFNLSRYEYFYIFFLHSAITAFIFFSLPRYQTMMKILMLPFAAVGAAILYEIVKKHFFEIKK